MRKLIFQTKIPNPDPKNPKMKAASGRGDESRDFDRLGGWEQVSGVALIFERTTSFVLREKNHCKNHGVSEAADMHNPCKWWCSQHLMPAGGRAPPKPLRNPLTGIRCSMGGLWMMGSICATHIPESVHQGGKGSPASSQPAAPRWVAPPLTMGLAQRRKMTWLWMCIGCGILIDVCILESIVPGPRWNLYDLKKTLKMQPVWNYSAEL